MGLSTFAQTTYSVILKDSIGDGKLTIHNMKAGSCGSPDGSILQTPSPPASWSYLDANGYCYAGINSTATVTMCFTFVPSVSSVLLNGGFSESCNNNTFTNFTVYDAGCNFVTTSLSPTGLIAGDTYIWCITMRAWGGPSCTGYATFCPYWIDNTALPVELEIFEGYNKGKINYINWVTATEINNDYFTLERSRDAKVWKEVANISGNGNSNTPIAYEFKDDSYNNGTNYYRLTQPDFDGKFETFEVISITTPNVKYLDYRIINLLGQEIQDDINKHRIIIWSDNTSQFIPFGFRTPKRVN